MSAFRERVRSSWRAAKGMWIVKRGAPDMSLLVVYVHVSKNLLDSGDAAVADLVAKDASSRAREATIRRMGLTA